MLIEAVLVMKNRKNNHTLDLEPAIAEMLEQARHLRKQPPYKVRGIPEIKAALEAFLADKDLDNPMVSDLKPLGGGASKEQFVFNLIERDKPAQRCVLRMDPLESAVVTSREREFAILDIMQGVVPVPKPMWADYQGDTLGSPGIITDFITGVTKPSNSSSNVSGFGTVFEQSTREALSVPFMKHFVAMHGVDWRTTTATCFQAPTADPYQAARWQVNWWATVWQNDATDGFPLMGLTERWMRDNLPAVKPEDLVFVHSDYRTGNYLYDEESNDITTILDWELIHIGDFHEDIAWASIKSWSTQENGTWLSSGLMPLEELCQQYSEASGREVNMETLYFYQVLGLYKCVAICLASSVNAARHAHNHQDALLAWLAAAGHTFLTDLNTLLAKGSAK